MCSSKVAKKQGENLTLAYLHTVLDLEISSYLLHYGSPSKECTAFVLANIGML
jgi:hypothetical protein